jgi:hypothetical protein
MHCLLSLGLVALVSILPAAQAAKGMTLTGWDW